MRFFLVLVLLFAIFHVSQHGLDSDADHVQDNCQVCRLAHLHGDMPPMLAMFAPMFVCLGMLVVIAMPFPPGAQAYSRNARAPPALSI